MPAGRAARSAAPASAVATPFARRPSAARPGRTTPAAQSRPDAPPPGGPRRSRRRFRCRSRPAAAAPSRQRTWRPPPRSRKRRAADAAAAARHARFPRHHRRRRRSWPRRGTGKPLGAKNLRQRAVALAGIRPARAEHGGPRRAISPRTYSFDELLAEADRYAPQHRSRRRASARGCRRIATASRASRAPARCRLSVQARHRGRPGADPGRCRFPVAQLRGHGHDRPLKSSPVAEAQKDPADRARPKIPDRVGQPPGETIAPVAQRVVLYDEDPAEPKGKQYVGPVVWRTEPSRRTAPKPISLCAPTSTSPTASSRRRCRSAATTIPRCRLATPRN